MINQIKPLALNHGNYYYIKNVAFDQYLTLKKSQNPQKEPITLQKLQKDNPYQIWMIQQVQPHQFQLVNAMTCLVLQETSGNTKLDHGKWKSSQLFMMQRSQPQTQPNNFYVKLYKHPKRYLYFNFHLKCQEQAMYKKHTNEWQLQLITYHPSLNQSCIIEYPHSNMVLDVPGASDKQCEHIVQYTLNKRFNQRWQIQRLQNEQYMIKSLKSGLVLDIKGGKLKQGTQVIQFPYQGSDNQKWILQQHGKRLYIIRSVMDKNFMLTIKDSSLKQMAQLVITKNQANSFWRIIGNIQYWQGQN